MDKVDWQLRKEVLQMAREYWEQELEKEKTGISTPAEIEIPKSAADFMLTKENEYSKICETLQMNAHFPTIHCYTLLKRKCEIELEKSQFREAGITLLQSQAITFHHQALQQYSKRTQKKLESLSAKKQQNVNKPVLTDDEEDLFKKESSDEEDDTSTWSQKGESLEQMLSRILSFENSEKTSKKFSMLLKKLPSEWRIVQLSAAFPTIKANPFKTYGKDEGTKKLVLM